MVLDLAVEKTKRATSNLEITVEELLKLALHEVQNGKLNTRKCLILIIDEKDDTQSFEKYRCGIDQILEEVGILDFWKSQVTQRILNNE